MDSIQQFPVAHLFTDREWAEIVGSLGVSTRQAQIVQRLLEGMGDKQIAASLHISTHTVRTHLERTFAKLEVQDRNELVVRVFRKFRIGCRPAACRRCH